MFLILLLTIILLPTMALTQTPRPRPRTASMSYYVSPQGNNANTCATARAPGASARRTLNGASGGIACLAPGDTLILQDGVWNEQIADLTDAEHPGTTRPPNGLSWSQPTTIRAEHPRGATLNKPGPGAPYGHVVMFGYSTTQYISVEDLTIDARGHNTCVWIGPSSHIRLQGNAITNCGGNGIFGTVADDKSGGTDIQLIDNEIFNISVEQPQQPGTHGIYFTGNNSVARGNYIHAPCPHYGMQYSSELGGLHHNVIENNRIVGCDLAGIISQGSDTIIRNNLFEHNCIGIYLGWAATMVANNTIYGFHRSTHCPDSYGILDINGWSTLTNNLVLGQASSGSYISAPGTPAHTANLCDATGSHACQFTATASSVVVDGPGGTLTLKPGGPAVDTGTATSSVPTDRLGVARPQGSGFDIGAYEYTATTPPIQPPTGDTTPPTAVLTSPGAGAQVSGVVVLTATASDNVGIAGLQFQLDGNNIGPEYYQAPFQHAWETTTTPPGPHTLTVSVRDPINNFGVSAPVSVTVVASVAPPTPGHVPLACVGVLGTQGAVAVACAPQEGRR